MKPPGVLPDRVWPLPGRRLPLLALLGLLPVLFLAVGRTPAYPGVLLAIAVDGVLLVLAFGELWWLWKNVPVISREIPRRLLLGVGNEIQVTARSRAGRPISLTVRDDLPASFERDQPEMKTVLDANGSRILHQILTPSRRGDHRFGALHVRLSGPLGLGELQCRFPSGERVKVYPNVLASRRRELAVRFHDLKRVGVHNIRRFGRGGEFEQLREYVQGDPFRDLDWKATAKRQRPITRVFQDERSQPILLAIDVGRMMAPALDGRSKLDHAIEAALLMAYVALKKGDRVGLILFEEGVQKFLPPKSGPNVYVKILEALYAVEPGAVPANFGALLGFLQLRVPRRSLVMMLTDLVDPTQSEELGNHASLLKKKHLPVCVTMKDPITAAELDRPPQRAEDVFHKAAAIDLWLEQEQVKKELRKQAIQLVDVPASELAVAAVNHYLTVKAKQQL